MPIHQNLKRIRERKKLSQQYLADRLHITQTAYSLIETGKTKIDVDRIHQLAGILDVPFTYLMMDNATSFNDKAANSNVTHSQGSIESKNLIEVLRNELTIKNEQISMLHQLLSEVYKRLPRNFPLLLIICQIFNNNLDEVALNWILPYF
ncbi:helix-turn-helix domain-containing protein [Mucilaginibacter lappiensis]|uniref:Transcriptional regulator with XRE-family HTH domain n=1 Tax=Mucilaginibacter lappiensis TaxID=354630 RepID=A0A841JCH1_9SPHI|nr:helix-turn-helix transcriptional regulator [Mucilaginibacter lappiensis]MBB6128849.1 transcriptional regulator with XRE-family HTH domain [Mucilaginibacter lappiensis]